MATKSTEVTRVVFRMWIGTRNCFALFPDMNEGNGLCGSYEHVGQHGGASYQGCMARSRPAKPAEYDPLRRELEERGYALKIARRR